MNGPTQHTSQKRKQYMIQLAVSLLYLKYPLVLALFLCFFFSLLQSNEILNTALLTGISQKIPVKVLALEAGGHVVDVTKQAGCETPSAQIVQVCIIMFSKIDVCQFALD